MKTEEEIRKELKVQEAELAILEQQSDAYFQAMPNYYCIQILKWVLDEVPEENK